MDSRTTLPTPFPEVNQILQVLQPRIVAALGDYLVGLYLDGSLARGGFDTASDIDFVAVTEGEVSAATFAALRQMHAEIGELNLRLAQEIEGYYVPRAALRRYDPVHKQFPNLERGAGERLKWVAQGPAWIIHRYILREYGIVLTGPPLVELIDPVLPTDLQRTMGAVLAEWGGYIWSKPELAAQAGYQPYAVLTICRMLYTLEAGEIVAKTEAAEWAKDALEARWKPLIEAAPIDRVNSGRAPTPKESEETLAFLKYALEYRLRPEGSSRPLRA